MIVKNKFKLNKSKEIKKTLEKLPKKIGNNNERHFKESFRKKGFTDSHLEKWPARKEKGRGSLMLVSGALKRSIRRVRTTKNKVVSAAGDNKVKYAEAHNQGAEFTQKVTPKQRAYFRGRAKATKQSKWKAMSLSKELNIKIPQRKFMGRSRKLDRKNLALIKRELNKIL